MNKLRKDDPVYYKVEMNKLIKQARENRLKIGYLVGSLNNNVAQVTFEADNGDIASATVYDGNWDKEEKK